MTPELHDPALHDPRIATIVSGLAKVPPARRRPPRSIGRRLARWATVCLVVLVLGVNLAAASSPWDMPRIPYVTWVSPEGNIWKDTSGDGIADEVHATAATPSPLGCSLLGMSGPDAAAYVARRQQVAIWELGIASQGEIADVRELHGPPPEGSVIADEVYGTGEAMRITVVLGDVSVFRSLAPTTNACR